MAPNLNKRNPQVPSEAAFESKMVFSLYGDILPVNIDMLVLQKLSAELEKPGVTAQNAATLLTQAADKTGKAQLYHDSGQDKHMLIYLGPFTIDAMTEFTPERRLGRAGMHITRLRTTQLLGNQICASLQRGVDEVYSTDIWGHEAFKIAYATLPDEEVAGKFAIADRNEMNPPLHADIVVVLPSVDVHRHINITQACIYDGVTVIHFICIGGEWRAVSIDHGPDPQWVGSDEQMSDEDTAGIIDWFSRLCVQREDIGARAGDGDAVSTSLLAVRIHRLHFRL